MPALISDAIPRGTLSRTAQPVLRVGDDMVLRAWLPGDAPGVRDAYQDPDIQRWHVRKADSVEEAREWIEGWRNAWQQETAGHWAVVGAHDGTLLGRLSLKSLVLADGTAEVAYWTAPSARGRGVCSRALVELAAWALGEGGFHRLELEHSTANQASCRVAARAGFAPEGVRHAAAQHADGWHDMHLHARVREHHWRAELVATHFRAARQWDHEGRLLRRAEEKQGGA
jgi:RimJ/RimL family protein N-acetyltransferase